VLLQSLIDAHGRGKICDFGFAIELPSVRSDGRSMFTAKGFARSEGYYPSELTSGHYSAKSDVYSYGVVS
jgi:serine/threonine protein kinase